MWSECLIIEAVQVPWALFQSGFYLATLPLYCLSPPALGINQVFRFLYLDALTAGALPTLEGLPLPELASS